MTYIKIKWHPKKKNTNLISNKKNLQVQKQKKNY